jgi:Rrf2 family cysteine metabolism transcriptional repressor
MPLKLSTKGRYGLRAMIDLAAAYGEGPVLVRNIAESQEISSKYLHALLASLKSSGLVRSVRGSGGGFVLAREPASIKLTEILEALEGPLTLVDCVGDQRLCGRAPTCAARDVWIDVSEAIAAVLSGITLADLLARQRKKG